MQVGCWPGAGEGLRPGSETFRVYEARQRGSKFNGEAVVCALPNWDAASEAARKQAQLVFETHQAVPVMAQFESHPFS